MRKLRILDWKAISILGVLGVLLFGVPLSALAQGQTGYTVITVSEMKKMLESGPEALIVDTLSNSAYAKEHIQKAKNFEFPNETMDRWNKSKTGGKTQDEFTAFLGEDKDKPIIFYCLDEK